MVLPDAVLYRGTMICMPLIGIIRMALRPGRDPRLPFDTETLSAESIYKRTWLLNGLWVAAFIGIVVMNVTNESLNPVDFLRSALILPSFKLLFSLSRRTLGYRTLPMSLFTNVTKHLLNRKKEENVIQEITKGEPNYKWYLAINGVLFVQIVLAVVGQVSPWLAGADPGWTRPLVALVAFAAPMLSWRIMIAANHEAARAIDAEIEACHVTTETQRALCLCGDSWRFFPLFPFFLSLLTNLLISFSLRLVDSFSAPFT
jgi:hypothetical protein